VANILAREGNFTMGCFTAACILNFVCNYSQNMSSSLEDMPMRLIHVLLTPGGKTSSENQIQKQ